MTPKHSYFEFLCALAELGQLSPSELSEFREHCQFCAACRQRLLELTRLHATMVVTNALNRPLHQAPRNMTRRFIARAVREGVPVNERNSPAGAANLVLAGATLLLLLVAGTIVSRDRIASSPALTEQVSAANSVSHDRSMSAAATGGTKQPAPNVARSVDVPRLITASPSRRQDFLAQPTNLPLQPLITTGRAEPQNQNPETSNNTSDHASLRNDALLAELSLVHAGSFDPSSSLSRFRFSMPRENSAKEPNLLTACICSPLVPLGSRTNFALSSSAQFFDPNVDTYRATLKPEFRPDPAKFQLIENVRQ